jgi:predicted kinase
MQKVLILKGCPASGKSSYCRELLASEQGWKRINNDDLRRTVDFSVWSPENEKTIKRLRKNMIIDFLSNGYNVVIDNVNAGTDQFKECCKIVGKLNIDADVFEKSFFLSLDELIERDSKRIGIEKVGEEVIRKFWSKLGKQGFEKYNPKQEVFHKKVYEQYVPNEDNPRAIICDIDGTLALIGDRSPYDASRADELDKPNIPVVKTVKLYYEYKYEYGYNIIFCSGREDKYKEQTIRFIEKHLPNTKYQLFMRSTGDVRSDDVLKEEIFNNHIRNEYNVEFVLDDREKVVSMWRSLGLTCFQVAPGDF